ncbi:HEAT repeat protein, partial [Necator americanus]
AAETGVVRVRNISTASGESNLLTNLRAASNELLHPLILACATRQAKLVQIALQSIQRLVQHRVLEASCANVVVTELWGLVEVECEELRVLQTVPPLVSADLLVTGNTLAKCIVMCFRMHFAKDPVVINAASAAVRQLVGCVFERVIQEDGVFNNAELTVVASSGGRPSPRSAPPTLRPCAADAYMLFKDLCLLINAKPSVWLIGIHEMTRTLGLELIESILKSSPGVFFRHPEFCDLLKSEVCPLVIKLFSPSLKTAHVSSQHPSSRSSSSQGLPADRPYFPIAMRLVRIILCLISLYHQLLPTECEIFLSSLMKFVDVDRRGWQRALSLEALHRVIARPDIIRLWICENFDARSNSTKVLEHLSNSIFCVIQQCFIPSKMGSDIDVELDISQPKAPSGDLVFDSNSALHEVVASGTPCPSPIVAPDKWNDQVMLTSRNLQAARILLCSICAHATMMDELWYLCMLTCQHITWLLAIRPLSTGIFTREKTENDQQSNCANVITTAALSETPVLTSLLDKIACSSVSLSNESLLKAMESIMRLSDENVAVAATGRDCSLFPLAMLLRFSFLNLHRQNVFWSRVTTHFIKVCGHTTTTLREWAALALASIIKQAFKVKTDMNVAVAWDLQWTISDFVFRKSEVVGADTSEKVWLVLYTCLSELCVDARPSIRKSACQTLLQTVASHGHALRIATWNHMVWQIIMPLLDRVRVQTRSASTERASGALLMHHSRDTQQKQWTETCIHTLSAASKIFIAQRKALLLLEDFASAWEALLSYLEWAACYQNAELSLSAIKSFQVCSAFFFFAVYSTSFCTKLTSTMFLLTWQRISRGLARMRSDPTPEGKAAYVPGPSHLTTLLHIFPPLFEHVARHISVDELKAEQLPSVLEREWALHWIVPFAETSLRMAVEFLTATVAYPEIIRSLVVVDVVKHFNCNTLRIFFCFSVCPRLAADERKRDELTECQIVELVRSELLSHSSTLPPSMVQRLISILNRGSISQLDPTDVLASDSHAQRVELARTCFDALLSTSNEGNGRLGNVAVASLLQRCSQVMNDFVRDWSGTGDLRLPRGRVAEITSALQAVDSLIGRLARDPTQSELYSQLVSLYPSVVNVVVCARSDPTLESQLIVTLKSYQTLLLLQVVPKLIKES